MHMVKDAEGRAEDCARREDGGGGGGGDGGEVKIGWGCNGLLSMYMQYL